MVTAIAARCPERLPAMLSGVGRSRCASVRKSVLRYAKFARALNFRPSRIPPRVVFERISRFAVVRAERSNSHRPDSSRGQPINLVPASLLSRMFWVPLHAVGECRDVTHNVSTLTRTGRRYTPEGRREGRLGVGSRGGFEGVNQRRFLHHRCNALPRWPDKQFKSRTRCP